MNPVRWVRKYYTTRIIVISTTMEKGKGKGISSLHLYNTPFLTLPSRYNCHHHHHHRQYSTHHSPCDAKLPSTVVPALNSSAPKISRPSRDRTSVSTNVVQDTCVGIFTMSRWGLGFAGGRGQAVAGDTNSDGTSGCSSSPQDRWS